MIIKPVRKQSDITVKIYLPKPDNTHHQLEKKNHVKYLGVSIDDKLNWETHISLVRSRISKNAGIFLKLRHYLSPLQLRQLYFNLIYTYISYAIAAWGSAYKSQIQRLQTKQNHIARIILFSTLYGENTESPLPLLNLLDILTIENIFKLQALRLVHKWHKQTLPTLFLYSFKYAKDVHQHNTRYASSHNLFKEKSRTNKGKQIISSIAATLWQHIPPDFKQLSQNAFTINLKQYLLSQQRDSLSASLH